VLRGSWKTSIPFGPVGHIKTSNRNWATFSCWTGLLLDRCTFVVRVEIKRTKFLHNLLRTRIRSIVKESRASCMQAEMSRNCNRKRGSVRFQWVKAVGGQRSGSPVAGPVSTGGSESVQPSKPGPFDFIKRPAGQRPVTDTCIQMPGQKQCCQCVWKFATQQETNFAVITKKFENTMKFEDENP